MNKMERGRLHFYLKAKNGNQERLLTNLECVYKCITEEYIIERNFQLI